MSLDVLEAAKRLLSDKLISKAASSLEETEANTRKALKGAMPSILAGLLHESSRHSDPAIIDMLRSVNASGVTNNLFDLLEPQAISSSHASVTRPGVGATISGWLKTVFGSKLINIINAVSIYSDIKSSSANSILDLAASAALGPIAQYTVDNNLDAGKVNNLLQEQKSSIINAIPAGFNLTGSLGINSLNDIGTKIITIEPKPYDYHRVETRKINWKWVWIVFLIVTFGGLVWFFSNRASMESESKTAPIDSTTLVTKMPGIDSSAVVEIPGKLDSISGNYIYDPGAEIELVLPDSSKMKVGTNSSEARLFRMLTNTTWFVDTSDETKNWVTLDRVYFETGKSILTAGSLVQVANIATLVKNFPNCSIKIGGYTDNEGDSVVNRKISDQRAKQLMSELINLGLQHNQVNEAVGYGPAFPVCAANDSPDCRSRNRRVDLKIAAK